MKKLIDKIFKEEPKSKIVIEKIKNKFLESKVKPVDDYIVKDYHYLIYDFMIITYSEKTNVVNLSFDVSTRPDLAAFFALELQKVYSFDDVKTMEVYLRDDDGVILSGKTCIKKHQDTLKDKIVNEFVKDQFQTHYLKTTYMGEMC